MVNSTPWAYHSTNAAIRIAIKVNITCHVTFLSSVILGAIYTETVFFVFFETADI